jgi:NAD(P)-dependent dehydrogenase (short-subunit alcohol dehydrogenase family)
MGTTGLRGQRALITGAGRGIGRAIALALAGDGCELALVDCRPQDLEEAAQACERLGARSLAVVADLSLDDGPQVALQGCLDGLGGCNLLVHCAGVLSLGSALGARWQDWDAMLRVNLRSVMQLTQLALPGLIQQSNPTIIFIASVCGKTAYAGLAGYCASKHGVVGFANALFEDVRGHGVKVSSICPGYVNTDMLRHVAANGAETIQPEAVAETVRFIARFPASGCPTEIVLRSQKPPWP